MSLPLQATGLFSERSVSSPFLVTAVSSTSQRINNKIRLHATRELTGANIFSRFVYYSNINDTPAYIFSTPDHSSTGEIDREKERERERVEYG